MDLSFDIAISLGLNCECRYQISRVFWKRKYGVDTDFQVNLDDYGTFFFDWSVTPIDGLLKTLQNDFQGVLKQDMLRIQELGDGRKTVVDDFTNIEHPHDFMGTETGDIDYESLKNQYAKVREKYDYLIDKTRKLFKSEKSILFVRCGPVTDEHLNLLIDTLDKLTDNYNLLYLPWYNRYQIHNDSFVLNNPKIIYGTIKHGEYPGEPEAWDQAFKPISLAIP